MICGEPFIPTHWLQKKCPAHRGAIKPGLTGRKKASERSLTDDELEWKRYGESVRSKLASRPDAVKMPGQA